MQEKATKKKRVCGIVQMVQIILEEKKKKINLLSITKFTEKKYQRSSSNYYVGGVFCTYFFPKFLGVGRGELSKVLHPLL